MLSSEVFKEFYSKLVETLPMNDAAFAAKLFSLHLLPSELKNELNSSQKSSAAKATIFLDSVIEPSVTGGVGNSFDILLDVMEHSEYQVMKELAKQIRLFNAGAIERTKTEIGNQMKSLRRSRKRFKSDSDNGKWLAN